MSRGRKPLAMPRKARVIYLRLDLMAKLDLLLTDPLRDKPKYGAWTEYFEQLVEADIQKRMYEGVTGIEPPSKKEEST